MTYGPGSRCPDCGGPILYGENVARCPVCGFTRVLWDETKPPRKRQRSANKTSPRYWKRARR